MILARSKAQLDTIIETLQEISMRAEKLGVDEVSCHENECRATRIHCYFSKEPGRNEDDERIDFLGRGLTIMFDGKTRGLM